MHALPPRNLKVKSNIRCWCIWFNLSAPINLNHAYSCHDIQNSHFVNIINIESSCTTHSRLMNLNLIKKTYRYSKRTYFAHTRLLNRRQHWTNSLNLSVAFIKQNTLHCKTKLLCNFQMNAVFAKLSILFLWHWTESYCLTPEILTYSLLKHIQLYLRPI